MSRQSLPEELITLVQVIAETDSLRAWFAAVAKAETGARTRELARMAAEMQSAGEAQELITAVRALARPPVFAAAAAALSLTRNP